MLYVGANGGVYRSTDNGSHWTLFPNQATDGSVTADGGALPNAPVTGLDLSLGDIDPTTGEPETVIPDPANPGKTIVDGQDLLVASTYGRGAFGIRVAPLVEFLGLSGGGNVTNTTTPTITGYSEQSAFGNSVTVNLYDVTNPSNRILIGTGSTDATGKFTITLNPGFTASGLRTIAAVATDDVGTIGPDADFTVNVTAPVGPAVSSPMSRRTKATAGRRRSPSTSRSARPAPRRSP